MKSRKKAPGQPKGKDTPLAKVSASPKRKPGGKPVALSSKTSSGSPRRRQSIQPATRTADQTALLERARMQWQFGDWTTLAAIDWSLVEDHPDRAFLVLLIGSAHLQLGDQPEAQRFILASRDWGADRATMARILLAGAHNVLGRISAVRREERQALAHFCAAVDGAGGDPRLASQARAITEIGRLDLFDQVISNIRRQSRLGLQAARDALGPSIDRLTAPAGTQSAREAVEAGAFSSPIRGALAHVPSVPEMIRAGRAAIVVAGMRHSGSTALFNIVRQALEQEGLAFESFYSEGARKELLNDPDQRLLLVKTHEYRDDVAQRASVVITTRRDLRDTVASAKRRGFALLQRVGGAVEYAKYNRALHELWSDRSDYEFVYESYIASPTAEIAQLLHFLGLQQCDPVEIGRVVANLPADQYDQFLLSPTHVTDPERILTFKDTLSELEVERIHMDHGLWLSRYGYEQGAAR